MTTILVVDDNRDNMELMQFLLKAFDYESLAAANGAEAIRLAREKRPDLILMDIQMPEMDGYEATEAIKREPTLRGCPVVAVTAFAMVGDPKRILSSGFFEGYISKPIAPETFVAQVEAYLPSELRKAETETARRP
jgi:two-component system, cell cycle response regulator